jgi:hypothetical protein
MCPGSLRSYTDVIWSMGGVNLMETQRGRGTGSGSNVIPRQARPGLAGLRPHRGEGGGTCSSVERFGLLAPSRGSASLMPLPFSRIATRCRPDPIFVGRVCECEGVWQRVSHTLSLSHTNSHTRTQPETLTHTPNKGSAASPPVAGPNPPVLRVCERV